MTQTVLTVVADVAPAKLDEVREAVEVVKADPSRNALLPFAQFDSLHFASLVLSEAPGLKRPVLIFECNVDGSEKAWVAELARRASDGVAAVFGGCRGFPGAADAAKVRSWLADHVVQARAFHIGATGRSLARIRDEERLHDAIADFLDAEDRSGGLDGATPEDVRAKVQAFVRGEPGLQWALSPPSARQTMREKLVPRARAAAAVAAALALSPILVPVLLVGFLVLVIKERTDPVQSGPADPAHIRMLEEDDDLGALEDPSGRQLLCQNHLSSVIPVKPGILRAVLLPGVLFVLNLIARISFTKGRLGGIPSIHFAHWTLIDRGRHLVFLSNFDGSWESYLGEFIDKAAIGLTGVWSNTVNFPRTRYLIRAGAADGPRFRHWARASQCRTSAWYTAYPGLTMTAIDNNTAIREDLFTKLADDGTVRWLRRL